MQRSASSGALTAAGAQVSYIPKRVVQNGIFIPTSETPLIDLKPGQKTTTRQVYAVEAKELTDTYLNPDRNVKSLYQAEVCDIATPEAYKNRTQPIVPQEPPGGQGHHQVAHWKSTAKATYNPQSIAGAVYHRQDGPSCQAVNPPTCVGAAQVTSTCTEFYGHYGSDPRDRVSKDAVKMPVFKTPLTVGTAKGTMHVPGYSGFLATVTNNPCVARVEHGATLRSTDKTNLTEQYHINVLNYCGHVPSHPRNDRGPVQPTKETMHGRSYQWPPRIE